MGEFSQEDFLTRLVLWPQRRAGRSARTWFAVVGVAIAVIKLPPVIDGHWSDATGLLWFQALTLGWILLVSIGVRTVTPRHLVGAWLMGVFTAGALVDAIGTKLSENVSGNTFGAVLVPLLEESAKVIPVVFFVLIATRIGRGFGAIDCCLMGLAAGGGFGFYEDMLYGRMFSSGFGGLGTAFPTMLQEPLLAAGHMVWSGAVGLGIGIWITHRRHWAAWATGPLLIAVAMVDHGVINFRGDAYETLRARMLDGKLVPLLLLAGLAAALVVEYRIVEQSRRYDHLFAPAPLMELLTARPPAPCGPRGGVRQAQRLRNEAVYRWYANTSARPAIAYELGIITS